MNRLFLKKFIYTIELKKRFLFFRYTKTITLHYQEALLWDVMVFEGLTGSDRTIYLLEFIKKHSNKKINNSDISLLLFILQDILTQLKKTYFRDPELKRLPPPGEKKNVSYPSPDSAFYVSIAKELGISLMELLKTYTQAQLEYIVEGLSRNSNEATESGQKRNELRSHNQGKQRTQEEEDRIRLLLSKLD